MDRFNVKTVITIDSRSPIQAGQWRASLCETKVITVKTSSASARPAETWPGSTDPSSTSAATTR